MKMTDDQKDRLFEAAKKYLKNYAPHGVFGDEIETMKETVAEIEASNRPPEIRWCVSHDEYVIECMSKCQHKNTFPKVKCEIWTYEPKKREE